MFFVFDGCVILIGYDLFELIDSLMIGYVDLMDDESWEKVN